MTGLFTFDAPLYCDCNGVYCNTTVTNEMLNRFFIVVDKLYNDAYNILTRLMKSDFLSE